jgi:hypothetical protein
MLKKDSLKGCPTNLEDARAHNVVQPRELKHEHAGWAIDPQKNLGPGRGFRISISSRRSNKSDPVLAGPQRAIQNPYGASHFSHAIDKNDLTDR